MKSLDKFSFKNSTAALVALILASCAQDTGKTELDCRIAASDYRNEISQRCKNIFEAQRMTEISLMTLKTELGLSLDIDGFLEYKPRIIEIDRFSKKSLDGTKDYETFVYEGEKLVSHNADKIDAINYDRKSRADFYQNLNFRYDTVKLLQKDAVRLKLSGGASLEDLKQTFSKLDLFPTWVMPEENVVIGTMDTDKFVPEDYYESVKNGTIDLKYGKQVGEKFEDLYDHFSDPLYRVARTLEASPEIVWVIMDTYAAPLDGDVHWSEKDICQMPHITFPGRAAYTHEEFRKKIEKRENELKAQIAKNDC